MSKVRIVHRNGTDVRLIGRGAGEDCSHTHPRSVPTRPCPPGAAAPKRRETGIRSYGPGKFYTILDSYAYELGPDREAGDSSEGAGWYGLLYFHGPQQLKAFEDLAKSHNDTLTRDEKAEVKNSVGMILFERTDGI